MFEGIEQIASEVIAAAEQAQAQGRAGGMTDEASEASYVAMFSRALDEAELRATSYIDENFRAAADHVRRETDAFEARLLDRWRLPLDRYLAITLLSISYLNHLREMEDDEDRDDLVLITLTDLSARACRVANAVYHLLAGGFALDALARARSLHELAVTAYVIGEEAPAADKRDITERFLDHGHVTRYKDAITYQRNAVRLGMDPLSADEVEKFRSRYDEVLTRYGDSFRWEYGWASVRLGIRKPNFVDLEERAQLEHLRGYYKWASHEVHSSSRGLTFNEVDFRGERIRMVNRSNHHLADPAQIALIALSQCMTVILGHAAKGPAGLLYVQAICNQVQMACEEFVSVQLSIEQ